MSSPRHADAGTRTRALATIVGDAISLVRGLPGNGGDAVVLTWQRLQRPDMRNSYDLPSVPT